MSNWPITQLPMLPRPPFSWFSARVMAIVAHWCCACHQMSGMVKAAAITAPAANQRFRTSRRPPLSRAPANSARAKKSTLCLLASPRPVTSPPASHQRVSPVRPILATMSASPAHASTSKAVGPAR